MMNAPEKEAIQALAEAWNKIIVALPDGQDRIDAANDIHRLQRLIMAQTTRRDHPEIFLQRKP